MSCALGSFENPLQPCGRLEGFSTIGLERLYITLDCLSDPAFMSGVVVPSLARGGSPMCVVVLDQNRIFRPIFFHSSELYLFIPDVDQLDDASLNETFAALALGNMNTRRTERESGEND